MRREREKHNFKEIRKERKKVYKHCYKIENSTLDKINKKKDEKWRKIKEIKKINSCKDVLSMRIKLYYYN